MLSVLLYIGERSSIESLLIWSSLREIGLKPRSRQGNLSSVLLSNLLSKT